MKKRFIKRTAVLALVGATQLALLTGCGGDSKSSKKETTTETTTVSETDGSTSEGNTEVNEEAIDQVFNHIEINGKHVDFPFTLNDLGDEYEYGNFIDMGEGDDEWAGKYGAKLIYNGENIGYIYFMAENEEKINRDTDVIDVLTYDPEISINGIHCENSNDDALKKLSALTINYDDNGEVSYLEYSDSKYYATVSIGENKVSSVEFMIK